MTTPLSLMVTDAGRAALIDAGAGGTSAVRIVEAGVTATAFVNAPTLTALPGEIKRTAAVAGIAIDDTTIHLTIRDSSDDAYAVRGIGLYLEDGTLFATYSQSSRIMQKDAAVVFFLAADIRLMPGEAALVEFGDANFLNPPASEDVKGVAFLASIAEALAGAVADKIITPAALAAVLANYVASTELGVADGVATLGPDGKLAVAQRPPIDLIDVFVPANEAAMLALAATVGDFAVRQDTGQVFVLQAAPATTLANWVTLATPAPVSSVNGKVGSVVLNPADIGAPPTTRTISAGGLLTGGGALSANRTISLAAATAAEALAGAIADKALTPASLASILTVLNGKAGSDATIGAGGILSGGGEIGGNPTISLLAATAAEILAGTSGSKVVTPASLADLPRSLTPNGYAFLPGGLVIQWVRYRSLMTTEATVSVAFPTTFPTIALPIALSGYTAAFSTVRDLWPQIVGTPTTTGCVVQVQSDDGKDMRLDGFDLIVLGF